MDEFQSSLNPQPSFLTKLISFFKKKWVLLSLSGVVIFFVVVFSIDSIMKTVLHSRPEVIVPDLEGKSLQESLKVVSEIDLSLKEERTEFDERLPAGTIVQQHPPGGMRVRAGRSIQVVVSKGGQVVFIPDVVGKPLQEAQSLLAQDRLQMGAVNSIYSSDVQDGVVITQDPSSGTISTRGAFVDIDVSKGPPPSGVPLVENYVGRPLQVLQDWAEGAGLKVKVTEDKTAVGVAGTVVRQDPAVGQPVTEAETMHVVVVPIPTRKSERYSFTVPSDKSDASIRIMLRDSRGENEIYKAHREGGDVIEVPINITSAARIRIYVNEILEKEDVVQP